MSANVSYQWFRGGVEITGANNDSYTLTNNDVGQSVTVTATFTDNDDYEELATSPVYIIETPPLTGFLLIAYGSTGSNKYIPRYNVTNTDAPTWDDDFSQTVDIGSFAYTHLESGIATGTAPSKVFDFFDFSSVFRLYAYCGSQLNDDVLLTFEILDANEKVLAAVKASRTTSFTCWLYYGTSLNNMTPTGRTDPYNHVRGDLTFTESGITYTNASTANYNNSFQFNVDLTTAAKIRVSGRGSAYSSSAAGCYILKTA